MVGGQKGVSGDHRGNDVFVIVPFPPLVVVGQGSQVFFPHQRVQGAGGFGGPVQFVVAAVRRDGEFFGKLFPFGRRFRRAGLVPQGLEKIHFQQFKVVSKHRSEAGQVGVDVQHTAVVVAQDPHPGFPQGGADTEGGAPFGDVMPGRFFFQPAGNNVVVYPGVVKHIGDLRGGACLAVGKPFPGHKAPVPQGVKRSVVDGRHGLEVKDHHGNPRALGHGQDRVGKGIGGDIKKNRLHSPFPKEPRRLTGLFGIVHEARIHQFQAAGRQFFFNPAQVAFQPFPEAPELGPVGVKTNSHKSDTHGRIFHQHSFRSVNPRFYPL